MAVKFTKELTELLNNIGTEAHTIDNDGKDIPKNEVLIRRLWDIALGYEEIAEDTRGKVRVVKHKPQRWALELIYSRKEGAVAGSVPEEGTTIKAKDRVKALSVERANRLAKETNGQ